MEYYKYLWLCICWWQLKIKRITGRCHIRHLLWSWCSQRHLCVLSKALTSDKTSCSFKLRNSFCYPEIINVQNFFQYIYFYLVLLFCNSIVTNMHDFILNKKDWEIKKNRGLIVTSNKHMKRMTKLKRIDLFSLMCPILWVHFSISVTCESLLL